MNYYVVVVEAVVVVNVFVNNKQHVRTHAFFMSTGDFDLSLAGAYFYFKF